MNVCLSLFIFSALSVQQVTSIEGPASINGHFGEDALFLWNTTDQRKILSASWGIRKGNIADPQFINVNVRNNRVNKNQDLKEAFRNRTDFIGDLNKGRAWFKLKNLTVTDTNYYIASISDTVTRVLPYYVRLEVKEKREKTTEGSSRTSIKPTEGSSHTSKTSTADYEQTTANNTKITEAVNMTTTIPNNTTSDQTMITTNYVVAIIVPLVCVVFIGVIFVVCRYFMKKREKSKQGKQNPEIIKEDNNLL